MDACNMEFSDGYFNIVFDKGTTDALLSHGEEEIGTNPKLQELMSEVYRVLKPGGIFCLISGNEEFVTFPYLLMQEWDIEKIPLIRETNKLDTKQISDFAHLSIFLYKMTVKKDS
jgi:ubiquinone/menaquinone biosynthesis C-methylase UbiE